MNMKFCGFCNVSKHIEIKDSDKYINLDISLKFGSLENMIITSSKPKYNLGRSVKVLIVSLGLTSKARPKKYKTESYAMVYFSMKDLSNIIRKF